MKQINLTKKAVGDGTLRLSEGGKFVTNGHWICRRDLLKQGSELTSVAAVEALYPKASNVQFMPEDSMERVVPTFGNPVVFTKTRWIQDGGCRNDDSVLFVAKDGSQTWIARIYVNMFDLDEVVSQSCPGDAGIDPVIVGTGKSDWKVVVMPKRIGYQEGLK